jgi:hypothetical protein
MYTRPITYLEEHGSADLQDGSCQSELEDHVSRRNSNELDPAIMCNNLLTLKTPATRAAASTAG